MKLGRVNTMIVDSMVIILNHTKTPTTPGTGFCIPNVRKP